MPEEQLPTSPVEPDATAETAKVTDAKATARPVKKTRSESSATKDAVSKDSDQGAAKSTTAAKTTAAKSGTKSSTGKTADARSRTTKTKAADTKAVEAKSSGKKKVVKHRSRAWVPWVFCTLGLVGLAWLVLWYLAGPQIAFMVRLGDLNILIGMGLIAAAFVVATLWK